MSGMSPAGMPIGALPGFGLPGFGTDGWGVGTPIDTATAVVSVADVKDELRLAAGQTHHDALLARLIARAVAECERYQGHKYLPTPVTDYLDTFPAVIRPVWAPLISVTGIAYIDATGAAQVLDAARYDVDACRWPGRIVPAYGQAWPAARGDANGVVVQYVAGYTAVPETIVSAVTLRVIELYYAPDGGAIEMGTAVRALLGADRIVSV